MKTETAEQIYPTDKEINALRTICCKAKYKRIGRAHIICSKCKTDATLELVLIVDALTTKNHENRNKKKVR